MPDGFFGKVTQQVLSNILRCSFNWITFGFKRYIIVDDDLLVNPNAPAIQDVPDGFIGLCRDAEQRHAEAPYVDWTANTGFIVANAAALHLLEEAYKLGDHNYTKGDGSFRAN